MLAIYTEVYILYILNIPMVWVCSPLVNNTKGFSKMNYESSSCCTSSAKLSIVNLVLVSSFNVYFSDN